MEELLPLYRSKLKVAILKELKENNMSPVMLAKKLSKPRPSVSRSLIELEGLGWVEVTNPEADKWRIYKINSLGKKVFKNFFE